MIQFTISSIAGGNKTALIWNYYLGDREKIARSYLEKVEQVGFALTSEIPRLEMAGGELCINATLAFASQLSLRGKLLTSGLRDPVSYINRKGITSLKFPLYFKKIKNIVLFERIGYVLISKENRILDLRKIAEEMCLKYNLPAFGIIVYDKNRIAPYVYVKKVGTFVKETACGSGSIAYSLFSGESNIIQPTGECIEVKSGKFMTVSGKVSLLNINSLSRVANKEENNGNS